MLPPQNLPELDVMKQSVVARSARSALAQTEEVTAARRMLETFARGGVRVAFGIPGGLVSPLFAALRDVPEIELISTRHETMAAFCAMGHAVATGMPALVLTTSGPGITNMVTGVAAALAEELPLIAIGGEVSRSMMGRGAFQDASTNSIDAVTMFRSVTRWSARVEGAAAAVGAAEQAIHVSLGPRAGPVFLSVPLDVANTVTTAVNLERAGASIRLGGREHVAIEQGASVSARAYAEVAARLQRARRPLLVVGNGARSAAPELLFLAERLSIPVVTTAHAKGVFPESHPLHLGIIGFGGHPSAEAYLSSSPDVVCVIGSRLGDFATNGWALPIGGSEATYQIDREPWLIGRNYAVTLGIVSDAAAALRGILAVLPMDVGRPRRETAGIKRIAEAAFSPDEPLKQRRVLAALQEAFPDAFWTADIGEHCGFAAHYLEADGPDRFRAMLGLASMGSGIGVAMGARHARRDRPVVAICGDGGFAMHAGDILTCVEEGIDVVLVVMNDGRWNMVHHGFRAVFGRVPKELPTHVSDIAEVARGFGAIGVCIRTLADLDPETLRLLAGSGRPVVLDVRIDPEESISVASRSAALRTSAFGGAA